MGPVSPLLQFRQKLQQKTVQQCPESGRTVVVSIVAFSDRLDVKCIQIRQAATLRRNARMRKVPACCFLRGSFGFVLTAVTQVQQGLGGSAHYRICLA